jgi:hypothetical protein
MSQIVMPTKETVSTLRKRNIERGGAQANLHDPDNRPERLLHHDLHLVRHVHQDLRGDVRRALLGLGEVFGGVDEGFGALGDGSVDLGADSGGRGEGDDWTEVGRRGEGVGEDVLLLKGVGDQLFEAGRERC